MPRKTVAPWAEGMRETAADTPERIGIANLLRKWRSDRGMSATKLADYFGVTQRAISKWERGGFDPRRRDMLELALDHYECLHGQKHEPEQEGE